MRLAMLPKPLSLSSLSLSLSLSRSLTNFHMRIAGTAPLDLDNAVHAQLCLRQRTLRNRALSSTHRASSSKGESA